MNYNLVQDAKNKIYNSELMKYVKPEKIEEAFKNIYVYNDREEFLKVYGKDDYNDGMLEGFNRKNGSYLGPDATAHTAIHEVMHSISSKFDDKGHRIVNGIMGDGKLRFADQVNEGMTDYISSKISGEIPRHYIQGHKIFERLEPTFIKYTKNPNIFMQMHINNDVQFMHDFLNTFGKKDLFENLYNNFLFLSDKDIDDLVKPLEKNVNKYMKKTAREDKVNNIFNKIKNIFNKNKPKMLTDGKDVYVRKINAHDKFVERYDIGKFETRMPNFDDRGYYPENYKYYNYNDKLQQKDSEER